MIFSGLILAELVFIALSTGHMAIQFKSPLLENIGFFMVLAGEDLTTTLRIVLLDNPLFIIQSKYTSTDSAVWSLHYFSFTLLVHLLVAYVLSEKISRHGILTRIQDVPFSGSVLLIASSIYLLLAACCTDGPHWIFQTWLLAVVFNPITSSNATIQLYQVLRDWFIVPQLAMGGLGAYLLWYRKK